MANLIMCNKLQKEGEALDRAPYPGDLGERILSSICKEAWQMWIQHQTMLINEHRLNLIDKKSRDFLQKEMLAFLFGDGSAKPDGYTPETRPDDRENRTALF